MDRKFLYELSWIQLLNINIPIINMDGDPFLKLPFGACPCLKQLNSCLLNCILERKIVTK